MRVDEEGKLEDLNADDEGREADRDEVEHSSRQHAAKFGLVGHTNWALTPAANIIPEPCFPLLVARPEAS